MLVVLASRYDRTCADLVADWAGDASLLTCQDLSASGWRYSPGDEVRTSVIGGRLVATHEIDGVLTRLSSVWESELGSIVPDDRSYVAAEMTAFLSAWLSDLPCPVLNRPAPMSLMGPYWRSEKWALTAAQLGMPVVPAHRSVPAITDIRLHDDLLSGLATVNVIGRRCLGNADESLFKSAVALAEAAGVSLLRARFASGEANSAFLDADYEVDVADPEVSAAILKYLAEGRR